MNYASEKKFRKVLTVDKELKKENAINRIVVENFGSWDNFRRIVKDAWKNIEYNLLENKSTRNKFTREILQSNANKISSDDFKKLSYLIVKEIKRINRSEEKVKTKREMPKKSIKGKYIQPEMPFSSRENL